MRAAILGLTLLVAACAGTRDDIAAKAAQHWRVVDPLPPMKRFSVQAMPPSTRSNASIARDFLDLSFMMESGRSLDRLTRFEGPIGVAVLGPAPATAEADLAGVLHRLRREARIDIHEIHPAQVSPASATPAGAGPAKASPAAPAQVTIEFVERHRLQALAPTAACFVVPRVSSFAEYRAERRAAQMDWSTLERRERVAIFIPSDTSPQEVRDCLHEELAQAIGPLNDLYRLSDSVFNDDNFHTVLTGFDMLVLRTYYAPELHSGMTRPEVARVLPKVLARLHPQGRRGTAVPPKPTPRSWAEAIETALGPAEDPRKRREAAFRAVAIAARADWHDARLGFSLFALARASLGDELELAVAGFLEAASVYRQLPDARIHAAHIDMQMAAFALSAGQPVAAIALCDRAMPVVKQAENAALLATLLMIRSESLRLEGHAAEARAARLDSLAWARYGFGSEAEVRARLSEIAALTPSRMADVVWNRIGEGE